MFTAGNADGDDLAIAKSKRRKISKSPDFSRQLEKPLFVPLLTGLENEKSVKFRYDLFDTAWGPRQEVIDVCFVSCYNDTWAYEYSESPARRKQ